MGSLDFGAPQQERAMFPSELRVVHEVVRSHVIDRHVLQAEDLESQEIWFDTSMSMWTWGEKCYVKVTAVEGGSPVTVLVKEKVNTVVGRSKRANQVSKQLFDAAHAGLR